MQRPETGTRSALLDNPRTTEESRNNRQVPNTMTRRLANILRTPARNVCRAAARLNASRTMVLLYHSIGTSKDAVTPANFRDQMQYLNREATVVPLEDILKGNHRSATKPLTCAITFDDGYASVYEVAYPILRHFGFPALVYVTTDAVGDSTPKRTENYPGLFPGEMTVRWSQLREMSRDGMVIGSHLCQHKDMTTLTEGEGLHQLALSKLVITQRLGLPCSHFAYPFGRFNRQNVKWVGTCGYESATTVVHATVGSHFDVLKIPRICIAPIHGMDDFVAMLRGDFDYLPVVQCARRILKLPYAL